MTNARFEVADAGDGPIGSFDGPWMFIPTLFAAGPLDANVTLPGPEEGPGGCDDFREGRGWRLPATALTVSASPGA